MSSPVRATLLKLMATFEGKASGAPSFTHWKTSAAFWISTTASVEGTQIVQPEGNKDVYICKETKDAILLLRLQM